MRFKQNWLAFVVVAGAAVALQYVGPADDTGHNFTPNAQQTQDGAATLKQAVASQRSEVWFAETQFELRKELKDDTYGDRHQRFLVERPGLPSLLVAHNIDLAPRAPLNPGMTIYIKGRYEWNAKGGVIHWTHHDPRGQQPGGWLRVGAKKYD